MCAPLHAHSQCNSVLMRLIWGFDHTYDYGSRLKICLRHVWR
jgi:hypothetical protein